jgi:hypothetical protein
VLLDGGGFAQPNAVEFSIGDIGLRFGNLVFRGDASLAPPMSF